MNLIYEIFMVSLLLWFRQVVLVSDASQDYKLTTTNGDHLKKQLFISAEMKQRWKSMLKGVCQCCCPTTTPSTTLGSSAPPPAAQAPRQIIINL